MKLKSSMTQKIIVQALSMDLVRVANGLHRGSISMAQVFEAEAFKKISKLEKMNAEVLIILNLVGNYLLHVFVEVPIFSLCNIHYHE